MDLVCFYSGHKHTRSTRLLQNLMVTTASYEPPAPPQSGWFLSLGSFVASTLDKGPNARAEVEGQRWIIIN
jgi:hypothetical protein